MKFIKLFIPAFIAIILILSDYKLSTLTQFRQSISTLFSPIYILVNLPGELFSWINEQGSQKNQLINENKSLKNTLLKLNIKLQQVANLQLENKRLKRLLNVSYTTGQSNFILAKINAHSRSRLKKQLTLNKGSQDGVLLGQVVLGAKGIVGQITDISLAYSTLLTISDPTQFVPVKSARNGVRGISKGAAAQQDKLNVQFIDAEADVKIGDLFISSAIGSKFPNDYPLGSVIKIEKKPHSTFLTIWLKPVQSSKNIEYVIVTTQP
jgi:rod shape-determining protein MreC